MDFFDRLALYAEAIGVENVAVAWDFASTDGMSDEDHFQFASLLGGWGEPQ